MAVSVQKGQNSKIMSAKHKQIVFLIRAWLKAKKKKKKHSWICYCGVMFINVFTRRLKQHIMHTDYIISKGARQLEPLFCIVILICAMTV